MARAGILYSQVAHAAQKLASEGKNPTVDTVRDALGGTGSKSTLAPMLKRWKAEHQEASAGAEVGLPPELISALKSVYDQLQTDVARRLEEERSAHAKERDDLHSKLELAVADHTVLKQSQDDLVRMHKRTEEELMQRVQELQANAIALTAAQTENMGLHQRLADRATEVTSLNQQLMQARSQFEHYQEAVAGQRAEERRTFEQRIARLEQELMSHQHRHEAQQSLLAQQGAKLAHQESDLSRLHESLTATQSELITVRTERDQQSFQIRDMLSTRETMNRELHEIQQALADAKANEAAFAKQAAMLADQLRAAEERASKSDLERSILVEKLLHQPQSDSRNLDNL
jgi:chromosome segregation ATPase